MSVRGIIREYWRVILLVVFVSVALVALFIPGGIVADDSLIDEDEQIGDTPTNLRYGLGLDGGTRIAAPPIGTTAENIELEEGQDTQLEQVIQEEMDVENSDVIVRFDDDDGLFTAEVFVRDVDHDEFEAALEAGGVDTDQVTIRDGVTQTTRDNMIRTIDQKINEAGLSGGSVYQQETTDGFFIVTEVPDMDPIELRELLQERGVVEVVAYHPDDDGNQTNQTVLRSDGGQNDFATIGAPDYNEQNGHHVPVTITEEAAPGYQAAMNDKGFTTTGVGQCDTNNWRTEDNQYCLLTVVDGEVVDAHSMGANLAPSMERGEWVNDPTFVMLTPTQEEAQSLAVNLQAGSLDAPLDFERDQVFTLQPALAEQFKTYSLFIGVLSVLAVSGMVYLRYSDVRVAAPMIVTALAEVLILLGFAAAVRMSLDLSHVAGFIAVVGTGVDDLIIIADEVMDDGDVSSERVFASRFKKAFWIIGAAAATTIIAMSPLAVMSLGDLKGFAIITILGVLIGVLITRPAYGDILRLLMTDK